MDLSDGTYLDKEIVACCGNSKSMWLIVWDGEYNYMLFNCNQLSVISRFKWGYMPRNDIGGERKKEGAGRFRGAYKQVEFYTEFDAAIKNLCKAVANNGFFSFRKIVV